MANKNVAERSGYYTRGKAQFKLRKGARLPDKGTFDDIFYYDEEPVAGTLTGQMSDAIARDQADAEEDFSVEGLAEERLVALEIADQVREALAENPDLSNEEVEELTLAVEGIEEDQAAGVEVTADEAEVENTAKPRRGGSKNKS